MKMKKKENIIIIVILVIMLIAIIGVSWAAFNFSQAGSVPNKITTGSITMTYEESDNTITLGNALPTTDATGMARLKDGEYFDFTVSSEITGEVNINYEISAKEVGDGTIDGSNIKLYLTELVDGEEQELKIPEIYNEETSENTYTGRPANEMSLYTSSMNASEEHNYRLRMYVTEEYNPQGDGGGLTFSVKVNVYGKTGNPEDILPTVSEKLLTSNLGNGSTYDDGYDTFITGEDPNNYIWYSGKLWRAVSVNNEDKTTKLVTQWDISGMDYNTSGNSAFEGSYVEDWLNDTSVDGFLGNLREPEKFIVTDAKWDATLDSRELGNITRPNGTTTVTTSVGLLNTYEYQSSYHGTTYRNGYLKNGRSWWTLTPKNTSDVWSVNANGSLNRFNPNMAYAIRPSIKLKSNVKVVEGNGTVEDPYRLNGDNDAELSGTLLNTRYSGEYIRFGNDENNLYRIVSHENGTGTKITSAEPLKENAAFKELPFGDTNSYSNTNTIGAFLNGEYLTTYVGDNYINMIEDNTTWYLGTVSDGTSYKLAKYKDTTGTSTTSNVTKAKVGLLRYGELMTGQFDSDNNTFYWTLSPESTSRMWIVHSDYGAMDNGISTDYSIKPSLNLKSNVVITSGDGTKNNPFTLSVQ